MILPDWNSLVSIKYSLPSPEIDSVPATGYDQTACLVDRSIAYTARLVLTKARFLVSTMLCCKRRSDVDGGTQDQRMEPVASSIASNDFGLFDPT